MHYIDEGTRSVCSGSCGNAIAQHRPEPRVPRARKCAAPEQATLRSMAGSCCASPFTPPTISRLLQAQAMPRRWCCASTASPRGRTFIEKWSQASLQVQCALECAQVAPPLTLLKRPLCSRVALLADSMRIICPDFIGFGRSGALRCGPSSWSFVVVLRRGPLSWCFRPLHRRHPACCSRRAPAVLHDRQIRAPRRFYA